MSGHMQSVLRFVESNNGVTGSEVATACGLTRQHANSVLRALHERNFIRAEQITDNKTSKLRWLKCLNIDRYWATPSTALAIHMPTRFMSPGVTVR